eukprot:jgi/Tetstr1/449014/TSEL_036239.t1
MEFKPEDHNCHVLVWSHVLVKGAQAGSFLGAASTAPSLALQAYRSGASALTLQGAVSMARGRAGAGLAYGLAATSVLGAAKVLSMDTDGAQDRAYRLHYNEGQNRCDRFWAAAAVAGGVVGAVTGAGPVWILNSAALGGVLGVLAHVAVPFSKEE